MQPVKQLEIAQILERLKSLYPFKTEGELARFLEIKHSRLSGWKARGTIDYEVFFAICEKEGLNPLWLFLGKGPPRQEAVDTNRTYISFDELPKIQIIISINTFWESATAKERIWFEEHFKQCFEFHRKWLESRDRDAENERVAERGAS